MRYPHRRCSLPCVFPYGRAVIYDTSKQWGDNRRPRSSSWVVCHYDHCLLLQLKFPSPPLAHAGPVLSQ